MKKVAQCILLLFVFFDISAQSASWDKYWHYRRKLLNQFVVYKRHYHGAASNFENQGLSIPSGKYDHKNNLLGDSVTIAFGDGTQNLGWYIGVLATEYKVVR